MSSWPVLTPFKQQSFVVQSSCAALSSKAEVIRSGPSSAALSLMQVPGTCAPLQACSPPSHSAAGKSNDTDSDGVSGIRCLHLTDDFRPQQGMTVFYRDCCSLGDNVGFLSNSCPLDPPKKECRQGQPSAVFKGFFRWAFLHALTNPEDTRLVINPPWLSVRLWFKAQQGRKAEKCTR